MDFWNSRGKFDEIKEEFMINPASIASQLSLNAGNHDEIEIFLEIRLIPFTNRSKVEEQERNTSIFKEDFGRKIVGN